MSTIERAKAFAASGVQLQGVPSKLMLAASMLFIGVSLAFGPNMAQAAEPNALQSVTASIQANVDEALGPGRALIANPGVDLEAAFAQLGSTELRMIFSGVDAQMGVDAYFRGPAGVYDLGAVTDADLARFEIYRQIGPSIAGQDLDDAEKSAFAAFAALRDEAPIELIEILAAKAELDQLTGKHNPISAKALQQVLGAANDDVLPTLTRFSLDEIASLSRTFGNDTRRDPIVEGFGEAFKKAMSVEVFYVPVKEGAVATNADAWLKNASGVPEIARILELQQYLYDRNSTGQELTRFRSDREASASELTRLAAAGDTVARALSPVFGDDQSYRYTTISTDGLASAEDVGGTLIPFDRSDLVLYTGTDGKALFAATTTHDLVFVADAGGMKRTFYEQAGHDASPKEDVGLHRP